MTLGIGDFVYHLLDGERLRIKSKSENVFTCEEIDKGKIETNIMGEFVYPIRISHIQFLNNEAKKSK